MLNRGWSLETSASLRDMWRGHSFGTCAFPDFTIIQCNMADVFLDYYMEAEDNICQILNEGAAARGW